MAAGALNGAGLAQLTLMNLAHLNWSSVPSTWIIAESRSGPGSFGGPSLRLPADSEETLMAASIEHFLTASKCDQHRNVKHMKVASFALGYAASTALLSGQGPSCHGCSATF